MTNYEYERHMRRFRKRNAEKRKERRREIASNIAIATISIGLITAFILEALSIEPRYAIASEQQSNGNYYTYVTERKCEVVDIVQDYITVSYNGNNYDFFGTGYEVGEKIICQFTDSMEIVGVVE